jgi:hypothetical protein
MGVCAALGCTVEVSSEHLMCIPHWRALPRAIRIAVNETWRNVGHDTEAYRSARDAAIQWHVDHPKPGNTQGSLL